MLPRIRTVGLAIAAALGLAACTDGYGYSGVSLGYGSAGYYDDPYYAGGYGGSSYYGWNNGYYYPGTGYYVYGRDRRPVRWNNAQRRYWEGRRSAYRGNNREIRQNWNEFARERRQDTREFRQDRRGDRREFRRGEVTRPEFRAERRTDRR